jgi:hypothetical protein
MPKIPEDAKKIIKSMPAKAKPGISAADRIERAADKEGMHPSDLIRFPDLLLKHRIKPEEATHGHASQAWRIYREKTDAMLTRYGSTNHAS